MIQTAVSPRMEIVRKVLDYPIPDKVIEKYIDKYGQAEGVAHSRERELKRYLAMCLANPEAAYGMFGPVDELWHTWILFTREWCEFSEAVAGRYIHHRPTTREEKEALKMAKAPSPYQRFLADYPAYYGEDAPADLWPGQHAAPEDGSCVSCAGGCGQVTCSGCFF